MVGIDRFNFPINLLTLSIEENQQLEKSSKSKSQAWMDIENGEMTLLVGKEKVKFMLNRQLTDEEKMKCRWIESSLLHLEKQAPDFLQEETLKGIHLNTNSVSTTELELELKLLNIDVEKLILMKDDNGERALATKDEGLKQRSSTFPMSLARL